MCCSKHFLNSSTGDSHLRCRVVNRPYDIFGTWFSDQHLISGDLHWLAHLVSTSVLWLNKANQEVDSEHVPIMNQLYKFYNRNASSIRGIMIANCPWLEDSEELLDDAQMQNTNEEAISNTNDVKCAGNPLSQPKIHQIPAPSGASCSSNDSIGMKICFFDFFYISKQNHLKIEIISIFMITFVDGFQSTRNAGDNTRSIQYTAEFREEYEDNHCDDITNDEDSDYDDDSQLLAVDEEIDESEEDDLDNLCPKYLIFSTGSKTYTPHQIGFKRIRNVNFPKKLEPGPSLKERIAAKERERVLQVSFNYFH